MLLRLYTLDRWKKEKRNIMSIITDVSGFLSLSCLANLEGEDFHGIFAQIVHKNSLNPCQHSSKVNF